MIIGCDLTKIQSLELGVGIGKADQLGLWSVPVDDGVGESLLDMIDATIAPFAEPGQEPRRFEASEKFGSLEYLTLPNEAESSAIASACFAAGRLSKLADVEKNLPLIRFYFARVTDQGGAKLVAVKQAAFFKRVIKTRALIRYFNDSLSIVEGPFFQLDQDFDFIVDADTIHIFRPLQFINVCEMQDAIRQAAPQNVERIAEHLPMFNLSAVARVVTTKSTAANLVASISSQGFMTRLKLETLKTRCAGIGIIFEELDGQMVVDEKDVMNFLKMIDRRHYEDDLSEDGVVFWEAESRRRTTLAR
jgi:hypothetical protein